MTMSTTQIKPSIPISKLDEYAFPPTLSSIDRNALFIVTDSDSPNVSKKLTYDQLERSLLTSSNMYKYVDGLKELSGKVLIFKDEGANVSDDHWIVCTTTDDAAKYISSNEGMPDYSKTDPHVLYGIYQDGCANVISGAAASISTLLSIAFENNTFEKFNVKNLSAASLTAVNNKLSNLTATNESVTYSGISNLTATNLTATSEKVTSLTATNLTATSEKVTSLTATNLTATSKLSAANLTANNITTYASIVGPGLGEGGPGSYSENNPLVTKSFVNSSINNMAAFYLTKNANGEAFGTKAELNNAINRTSDGKFWFAGNERQPLSNDYCVVLSDETVPNTGDYPVTTRYICVRSESDDKTVKSVWNMQYVVNSTPFTDLQWKTINAEITKGNAVRHTENNAVGSSTVPVYVDALGSVTACNSNFYKSILRKWK